MNRRSAPDRRVRHLIAEPLERQGDRREADRRESLRRRCRFEVVAGGAPDEVQGELGLGGGSFETPFPPGRDEVVVRLALPDGDFEAQARLVRREVHGANTTVHFAFLEPPVEQELRLARWLDQGAGPVP